MLKTISWLTKNLIIAIPLCMAAGFIYGISFGPNGLKQLIVPFTFLMVFPMMVTLKFRELFRAGDIKLHLAAQALNFCVIPFMAYFGGRLFFPDSPYMALGLLLASLLPTSGMTISWTGLAKGNLPAAIKMTVVGLTLGSLAAPFYINILLGADVQTDMAAVFRSIGIIVLLPMAAGYITQQFLIKKFGQKEFSEKVGSRMPNVSTIGVLGIVFIALALKAQDIAASPQILLKVLPAVVLLYLLNFFLSTVAAKALFNRADAIAMVYGTVMRNLSIALALAINAFGPGGSEAALVISASYIVQVQSAAWYVKFSDRIFGREENTKSAAF